MRDSEARSLPTPDFWCEQWRTGKDHSDLEGSRELWDKRAATFVHKSRKEDYISYFIEMLDLEEGDTVLDMACGAGALAIPLAKRGHRVAAVDFSSEMLANLRAYAEREGVADSIETYQRAWQEDFDGLPVCDIAIASRSLILDDLTDAVAKLESKARKRAVITLPGGAKQRHEALIESDAGSNAAASGAAIGNPCVEPAEATGTTGYRAQSLAIVVNYLFSIGRLPRVSYIRYPRYTRGKTREELIERMLMASRDATAEERETVIAFLSDHIIEDEREGDFTLDYSEMNRWSVIEWDPSES